MDMQNSSCRHCIPAFVCGILVVGTLLCPARTAVAAPGFVVPPRERQLFLDDYGIAKIDNLRRTMQQPVKKGAVIRPGPGGGSPSCIQTRTAPIWDPRQELYKISALGRYYESKDGLHWTPAGETKPRVDCMVYDPSDADPSRRFKAALPPRGFAVSPDGVSWKMLDVPGVPSSDEYNFSFDQQGHLFILTVKHGGPHGRAVHLSTSKDFEQWTKPELIFHADDLDQKLGRGNIQARFADTTLHHPLKNDPKVYNVDVYNMGVFRYEGLYIGIPAMYHATGSVPNYPNTVGFHVLQLACSRDLKTWKRLGDRKPFIGPSRLGSGAYDLTQILPPSYPIVRPGEASFSGKDELWFYYTGIKYRGTFKYVGKYPHGKHLPLAGLDRDQGAVCLAVLRRDGFISLDAGEKEGTILTEPFKAPGKRLFVNVDASKGELRVDVLDEVGERVAASETLKEDLPRGRVRWRQGDLPGLKGKVIALRFTLRNARFYSYWIED